MKGITKKFLTLVAVTVFAAACDSTVNEPLIDQEPVGAKPMVVMDLNGNVYTLPVAKTYPVGTTLSGKIGEDGGVLQMGDFAVLTVPEDAVEQTTIFAITVMKEGYIELDLSAWQYVNGQFMEVGQYGFGGENVEIAINMNYAKFDASTQNPALLWAINGTLSGTFQQVPTTLDDNWLVGSLDHFSKYVMASN